MTQYAAPGIRPAPQRRPGSRDGSSWRVPAALVALTIIPLIAGSLRLLEVAGGAHLLPTNPRIDASPAPLVVHVAAAAAYAVVGALQFPARLRRRHRAWHRRAGRVLIGAGLLVAGSGLWMTLFYPGAPGGFLLWTVRLVVGSAMAASIVLGFTAIRRRDIAAHRAWMIRGYALAVAAGTQAFTQGFGEGLFGTSDLSTAVSVSSGWVINAAVAEWGIRRRGARPARLALTHEDDGTTVLRGVVTDQSTLHGLLAKVRDLGVALISVTSVEAAYKRWFPAPATSLALRGRRDERDRRP